MSYSRGRRGWKPIQCRSASWRTSRRATGTPWGKMLADDYYCDDRRRVVNVGFDMVEMQRSKTCAWPLTSA